MVSLSLSPVRKGERLEGIRPFSYMLLFPNPTTLQAACSERKLLSHEIVEGAATL